MAGKMNQKMEARKTRLEELEATVGKMMDSFEGIDDALEIVKDQVVKIKSWRGEMEDKLKTCKEGILELTELRTVDITEMVSIGIQSEYFVEPSQVAGSVSDAQPRNEDQSDPKETNVVQGPEENSTDSETQKLVMPTLEKYSSIDAHMREDTEDESANSSCAENYESSPTYSGVVSARRTRVIQEKLVAANAMLAPVADEDGEEKKYNMKKFKCLFCDMILSQRGNGRRHIFKCHFNVKQTCSVCKEVFYDEMETDEATCYFCTKPSELKVKVRAPRDHHGRRMSSSSISGSDFGSRSNLHTPSHSPVRNWKNFEKHGNPPELLPCSPVSSTKVQNALAKLGKDVNWPKQNLGVSFEDEALVKPAEVPEKRVTRRRATVTTSDGIKLRNLPTGFDLNRAVSASVLVVRVDPNRYSCYRKSRGFRAATIKKEMSPKKFVKIASPVKKYNKRGRPKGSVLNQVYRKMATLGKGNSHQKNHTSAKQSLKKGQQFSKHGPERRREHEMDSVEQNGASGNSVYASKSKVSRLNPVLHLMSATSSREDGNYAESSASSDNVYVHPMQDTDGILREQSQNPRDSYDVVTETVLNEFQPTAELRFICPTCGQRFEASAEVKMHQLACHEESDSKTIPLGLADVNTAYHATEYRASSEFYPSSNMQNNRDGITVYRDYESYSSPRARTLGQEFYPAFGAEHQPYVIPPPSMGYEVGSSNLNGSPAAYGSYNYGIGVQQPIENGYCHQDTNLAVNGSIDTEFRVNGNGIASQWPAFPPPVSHVVPVKNQDLDYGFIL